MFKKIGTSFIIGGVYGLGLGITTIIGQKIGEKILITFKQVYDKKLI